MLGRVTARLRACREQVSAAGPLALVWGALLLSLGLVVASLADAGGLRRLAILRREVARVEAANAALRAQNEQLSRTVQKLSGRVDAAALEKAARAQLGFMKPDEVVFKFE